MLRAYSAVWRPSVSVHKSPVSQSIAWRLHAYGCMPQVGTYQGVNSEHRSYILYRANIDPRLGLLCMRRALPEVGNRPQAQELAHWRNVSSSSSSSHSKAAQLNDARVFAPTSGRNATQTSPLRSRRASTDPGVAWAVYSRLCSELYALGSRSIAGAVQLHPRQGCSAG